MKKYIIGIIFLLLVACSNPSDNGLISTGNIDEESITPLNPMVLPKLGRAPELKNDVWLNTEVPLRLSNLEGKVVLLEMWTYG